MVGQLRIVGTDFISFTICVFRCSVHWCFDSTKSTVLFEDEVDASIIQIGVIIASRRIENFKHDVGFLWLKNAGTHKVRLPTHMTDTKPNVGKIMFSARSKRCH